MTLLLLVEDEAPLRETYASELASSFEVETAATLAEARAALQREEPDVVLLDLKLPDGDGLELLRELRSRERGPEVVVLTAHGSVETAVQAMREGAFDFVEKPARLSALRAVLQKAAETAALRTRNEGLRRALRAKPTVPEPRSGMDTATVVKLAASELPVLVVGETGSGKEVAARALHEASSRSEGPFVTVDCTALPDSLIESELFGHERGAFTGADRRRAGLVEAAAGGTLFLDEIGDAPLALQAKLLRLLETGEWRSVGGRRTRTSDARVLAATHRALREEVSAGRFREDLFYRLDVLRLEVPPLRERPDEIAGLVESFLRGTGRSLSVDEEARRALMRYRWPGNVRELRNVVERLAVLVDGEVLRIEDLPGEIQAASHEPDAESAPEAEAAEIATLAQREREHVLRTLQRLGGDKRRTARVLGIGLATLYNKLAQWRDHGVQ